MPHLDVFASSLRVLTPVVADQQSPRVIVRVPVPKTLNPWASKTAAFPERPVILMQSAVVVSRRRCLAAHHRVAARSRIVVCARASTCR